MSNSSVGDFPLESVTLAVLLSGFVLNTGSLIAVIRSNLRCSPRYNLLSLVVSNLLVVILATVRSLRPFLSSSQCLSQISAIYLAYIEQPLIGSGSAFSNFIVVMTTVERFASIHHPVAFHRVHCPRIGRLVLTSCLVLAVIVEIPAGVVQDAAVANNSDCWLVTSDFQIVSTRIWSVYIAFNAVATALVPGILIVSLNAAIIAKYRKIAAKRTLLTASLSTCHFSRSASVSNANFRAEEKRVLFLFVVVSLLTAICIFPSAIIVFFPIDSSIQSIARVFQLFFYSFISFVYSLYNNEIYRQCRQLFCSS